MKSTKNVVKNLILFTIVSSSYVIAAFIGIGLYIINSLDRDRQIGFKPSELVVVEDIPDGEPETVNKDLN